MAAFEIAKVLQVRHDRCEDRIAVLEEDDRCVIVVADGAGGMGAGEEASEAVIREISAVVKETTTAEAWINVLGQTDLRIGNGQSTAVVVDVRPEGICGASVGDSQAWLIRDYELVNLTANQRRKPLLGSGDAVPVGLSEGAVNGVLIVASDGLCNYVKRADVVKLVSQGEFVCLPRQLLSLVRLRSGEFWDDVGIVVCRKRPKPQRGRKRYTLT